MYQLLQASGSTMHSYVQHTPENLDHSNDRPTEIVVETEKVIKVGRCKYCNRKQDKKTRKKCESCLNFVCHIHSKNILLCPDCGERFSLVWYFS